MRGSAEELTDANVLEQRGVKLGLLEGGLTNS